jgi:peroxiredoxin family protein
MNPLGILLISGGHERAHYALVIATAAAALGRR